MAVQYPPMRIRWIDALWNTPEEKLDYYVYVWYMKTPGIEEDQPFYVGSSHRENRWKQRSGRNRGFQKVAMHHEIYSKKVYMSLTEELAGWMEMQLKELLVSLGYQIMDGEHYADQKNRWIKAAKKEKRDTDPNYREGRPSLSPEIVEKIMQGIGWEELGIAKTTWYKYRRMNKN